MVIRFTPVSYTFVVVSYALVVVMYTFVVVSYTFVVGFYVNRFLINFLYTSTSVNAIITLKARLLFDKGFTDSMQEVRNACA